MRQHLTPRESGRRLEMKRETHPLSDPGSPPPAWKKGHDSEWNLEGALRFRGGQTTPFERAAFFEEYLNWADRVTERDMASFFADEELQEALAEVSSRSRVEAVRHYGGLNLHGTRVTDFQDSSIRTIAAALRWRDLGDRAIVLATNRRTGKETALTLVNWGDEVVRVYFHDQPPGPGAPLVEGVHWETTKPGADPFTGADDLTDVRVIYIG